MISGPDPPPCHHSDQQDPPGPDSSRPSESPAPSCSSHEDLVDAEQDSSKVEKPKGQTEKLYKQKYRSSWETEFKRKF
jgi:hypothetical protein